VEPLVALDLPAKLNSDLVLDDMYSNNFHKNILRVVFLSRISPMKNLDYALRVLSQVNTEVVFDIYGPLEDLDYWESCQSLIKELPQNIQVQYCGTALFTEVGSIFSRYDLFLFPTRGENYGHVIAESLSVGTCVLLSDQTPWQNLTIDRLGWDLTLSDILTFVEIVESMSLKSISDKLDARKHIISVMRDKLTSPLLIQKNQELFYKCLR
jgi:glycosyltransferase involved in cell wall biosynthesis